MPAHRVVPEPVEAPTTLDGFDVLDACHRQTVFTLGKLAALITRLQVRGPDEEAREMAAEIVRHFAMTVREHHADEERHVFPLLLSGGDTEVAAAVRRLQQDHHWLDEDWTELGPQLDAIASGQTGCDLERLREAAEVFIALCHDHIALEESCIYPEARARLGASARREIGREMAARRRAAKQR